MGSCQLALSNWWLKIEQGRGDRKSDGGNIRLDNCLNREPRGEDFACIDRLVPSVRSVLAAGAAGLGVVASCLAGVAAAATDRHHARSCLRAAAGDPVSA